jgi:hypothetical protein
MCNEPNTYVYDDTAMTNAALEYETVTPFIKVTNKIDVSDDGWCFYNALLTASGKPHTMQDCRQFALEITKAIIANVKDPMRTHINETVSGYNLRITVEQLIKLISIPNFNSKKNPCVYANPDQYIGNAAAVILNKNILIYNDNGNGDCEISGRYMLPTLIPLDPQNTIMLRRGSSTQGNFALNHFDIITEYNDNVRSQGGSKKRITKRTASKTKRSRLIQMAPIPDA